MAGLLLPVTKLIATLCTSIRCAAMSTARPSPFLQCLYGHLVAVLPACCAQARHLHCTAISLDYKGGLREQERPRMTCHVQERPRMTCDVQERPRMTCCHSPTCWHSPRRTATRLYAAHSGLCAAHSGDKPLSLSTLWRQPSVHKTLLCP